MFFSIQGFIGLKNFQVEPDADAEMNFETKNESLQQENTSDQKPFLNLLDQATVKRKISSLPENGQAGKPYHEDQKGISIPDLFRPVLKLENNEHPAKIPTGKHVFQEAESVFHLMCYDKGVGLNPRFLHEMEESEFATEEPKEAANILQHVDIINKKDRTNMDGEDSVDYLHSMGELPPGLQVTKLADLMDKRFWVAGSPQVSETVKSLPANTLMTNTDGITTKGLQPTGLNNQIPISLNSDGNHAAWEHSSLLETTFRVHDDPTGMNTRYDKITEDMPSKGLLNFSGEKSRSRQDSTGNMFEFDMKSISTINEDEGNHVTILNKQSHSTLISEKGADNHFQILKDSGFSQANNILQHLPLADAQNQTSSLNFHIRQAVMPFMDVLQGFENKIVNQVLGRLVAGFHQGSGNWMLNLHPPELGRVKVRIISGNGKLNVHLQAQNHHVAGVLERNLPTLKHSLEDQGVVFSDLQVSVETGNQDRSSFEEPSFYFTDREPSSLEQTADDQDNVLLDRNVETPESLQGLSLRV